MNTPSPYIQEFPNQPRKSKSRFFLGVEDEQFIGEVHNLTSEQKDILTEIINMFFKNHDGSLIIKSSIIKDKLK